MAHVASAGPLSISHDPRSLESGAAEAGWIEVLHGGMTFDVSGLSPATGAELPEGEYQFQFKSALPPAKLAAVPITVGPHLAGAEKSLPIIRGLVDLAAQLCEIDGCVGVAWKPARSWMGRRYFQKIVDGWMSGGPFPSLGLVGIRPTFDGALQTEGLSFFTNKELRIEGEIAVDKVEATKIAARLIGTLVEDGPIEKSIEFDGLNGEKLRLELSKNQRFYRVGKA